jgi:hypothetical protein
LTDPIRGGAVEILQHSLGLDEYGRGSGYRNHFVTGPGCADFATCRALTDRGLMEDHGTGPLYGGNHCFTVTSAGLAFVREHSPKPPKLTRSQRRYRDFLDADCGLSFGEWLGAYR